MHFVRLATTLLKDEESARDNHPLACNFARYSPIDLFCIEWDVKPQLNYDCRMANLVFIIFGCRTLPCIICTVGVGGGCVRHSTQ